MKIGAVLPQGWVGEYDGWDPLEAWRRTTEVARNTCGRSFGSRPAALVKSFGS